MQYSFSLLTRSSILNTHSLSPIIELLCSLHRNLLLLFFISGELEWVLDIDSDFRLLIINKKGNTTYSLCANKWKNVYASFVCRHLNISDNGIAGITSRNVNLSRISYGVDCLVNITDPFECNPDYSNHSKDICDSIGDASVKCYSKFPEAYLS